MESGLEGILKEVKRAIREEDQDYIQNHPEISILIGDFLNAMAETKPNNISEFTQAYFSSFSKVRDISKLKPLMIIGPSGSGKVDL